MLTRWGCDIADEMGVPTFIQSSPAGYRTYQTCGFEEVYVADLNLDNLGREGICRNWLMVRYPPGRSLEVRHVGG